MLPVHNTNNRLNIHQQTKQKMELMAPDGIAKEEKENTEVEDSSNKKLLGSAIGTPIMDPQMTISMAAIAGGGQLWGHPSWILR